MEDLSIATTQTYHPDLLAVIDLARLAPSVHNTQPWLFHVAGDVLTLCKDGARRQPVPGNAARSRHTQRGVFEPRPVAEDVVAEMRDAAHKQGAWVKILANPADQVTLAVLLARAEEAEIADPNYRDELAAWTNRPSGAHDGLPSQAIPAVDDRASTLKLRAFSPGDESQTPRQVDVDAGPADAEHVLAIVVGTAGDSVQDWLVAGGALIALLLRATIDGVQAGPRHPHLTAH